MDDLPPLPDGFTRVGGEWKPRKGLWHVQIRANGFVDTRVAYEPGQLIWKHEGHSGDIVAVKRAG